MVKPCQMPSDLTSIASLEGPFSELFKRLGHWDKWSLSKVSRAFKEACELHLTRICVDCTDVRWERFPQVWLVRYDRAADSDLLHLPSTVNALQVREAWIDTVSLRNLLRFKSLRSLDLQHCTLSGLEELTSLQGLTELNLNHVPNIKGLSDLLNLTQLECLHIGYSNVDRQMLHELSTNMPQLLSLDVSYSMGITHTGARDTFRYKNRAGGLTELILDGYADMRNLAPLELLSSFQSFSMKDCGGQDAWLESLSFLTGLTRLNISSNQDLTDEGMCFVARQASLRVLAIQDLPLLTSRGLRHLSSLTNLEMLKTFPLAGALPEGDLPRKVQQAMDAAAAEIPSLFLADITDDSD